MRRDIDKVVFERAKANRTWAKKTPRVKPVLLDSDGEQFNDATNKIRLQRQKYRNSHFNAVEHFLVCNVGRPWNKVYAEICESIDSRTLLGMEIRDRIKQLVFTNCWFEGLKLLSSEMISPTNVSSVGQEVRGLYVHPRSGLLQRTAQ